MVISVLISYKILIQESPVLQYTLYQLIILSLWPFFIVNVTALLLWLLSSAIGVKSKVTNFLR